MLSITSYNIQTDVRDPSRQQQDFRPGSRCQPLIDELRREQFGDIINLQEVPAEGVQRLQELQSQYHILYRQHSNPHDLRTKKNDGLVILLRKARFDVIQGTEKEIHNPGNPNISMVVRAIEKATQKPILVFNTHVRGGPQRHLGDSQVASLVNELNQTDPSHWILGGGDFNGTTGENRVTALMQKGFVLDSSPPGTITEPATNRKIDHLFAKNLQILGAGNQGNQGNFANSDHYPLFLCVDIPSATPPQPAPNVPYAHQQPVGSFREVLMRHFQVERVKHLLDPILTRHALTKHVFENSVKGDFRSALTNAWISSNEVDQFMNALDEAFVRAKLEKNGGAAVTPARAPQPQPAPIVVQQQPALVARPAARAHQPQPAPIAVQQQPAVVAPQAVMQPQPLPSPARIAAQPQQVQALNIPQPQQQVPHSKNVPKSAPKKGWTLASILTAPFRGIARGIRWFFAKMRALVR
ncbi:MAG: endonuclease/exonuclease/phosphatase family protein [Parachlamydia sp.]|nr:endonuclease/exonuclease/phosphatase family protein [Parachlamydia sp.]